MKKLIIFLAAISGLSVALSLLTTGGIGQTLFYLKIFGLIAGGIATLAVCLLFLVALWTDI